MKAETLLTAMVVATMIQGVVRLNWWYWIELTPEERAETEDDLW